MKINIFTLFEIGLLGSLFKAAFNSEKTKENWRS